MHFSFLPLLTPSISENLSKLKTAGKKDVADKVIFLQLVLIQRCLISTAASKHHIISAPLKLTNESSGNDEQLEDFSQYGLYSYAWFIPLPSANIAPIGF